VNHRFRPLGESSDFNKGKTQRWGSPTSRSKRTMRPTEGVARTQTTEPGNQEGSQVTVGVEGEVFDLDRGGAAWGGAGASSK